MAQCSAMRTPDGEWTVEVLATRAGECFRVRRRTVIGSARGWAPYGRLRFTVSDVQQLLGDRFADLVDV